MDQKPNSRISIQVSLSGYSFKIDKGGERFHSAWLGAEKIFTTPEFQRKYDIVEISLLTPKVALIPEHFFDEAEMRQALSEMVTLRDDDLVEYIRIPSLGAVLVYSNTIDESLSRVISQTVFNSDGEPSKVLPEMYHILMNMSSCSEYNKIIASYIDGYLHLAIAQGKSLLLCNTYKAVDFTTAEYFIFLAMKKLQLNPEVSTISLRTPVTTEQEMSLYRYFKSVEII